MTTPVLLDDAMLYGLVPVDPFEPAPEYIQMDEATLYGLAELELYGLLASAHWWCAVNEFCRNPLHPGPCKGWKHMLHSIAPGAYHAYEQQRVKKLNEKRVAKIKELEAAGKKIPAYLKKEITYQQAPKAPEGVQFQPPTPKEAISKLPATAKEIGAKIALKHEQINEAKAAKLKANQKAAILGMMQAHQGPMQGNQHAKVSKLIDAAQAKLVAGEKLSEVPAISKTLQIIAKEQGAAAELTPVQVHELFQDLKDHVDQGVPEPPILLTSAINQGKAKKAEKIAAVKAEQDALAAEQAKADAIKAIGSPDGNTHKTIQVIGKLKKEQFDQLDEETKGKIGVFLEGVTEHEPVWAPVAEAQAKKLGIDLDKLKATPEPAGNPLKNAHAATLHRMLHAVGLAKDTEQDKATVAGGIDKAYQHMGPGNKLSDVPGIKSLINSISQSANGQLSVAHSKQGKVGPGISEVWKQVEEHLNEGKPGLPPVLQQLHEINANGGNLPSVMPEHYNPTMKKLATKLDQGDALVAPNTFLHSLGMVAHSDVQQLSPEHKSKLGHVLTAIADKHKGEPVGSEAAGMLAGWHKALTTGPGAPKKVTGPLTHPDMMGALDTIKGGWTYSEVLHALGQPGVNKVEFEKLSPSSQDVIKKKLADIHDKAPAKVQDIAHKLGIDKTDVMAPPSAPTSTGASAPMAAHVKVAHALATNETNATSTKKVEMYGQLTQQEYHSLPLHVQAKIAVDLHEAHSKFLSPTKKAQVKAVQDKLGQPLAPGGGAAPYHEPAAPVHEAPGGVSTEKKVAAHLAAIKLSGVTPTPKLAPYLKELHAAGKAPIETQAHTIAGNWADKHLHDLPLSLAEKKAIQDKAASEFQHMIESGETTPPKGGVLAAADTADKMYPNGMISSEKSAKAGVLTALAGHQYGGAPENPPQAGAGGPVVEEPAKPASAIDMHAAYVAASQMSGGQGSKTSAADFKKAMEDGTLDGLLDKIAKGVGKLWAGKHPDATTAEKEAVVGDIKHMITSGSTSAIPGSILKQYAPPETFSPPPKSAEKIGTKAAGAISHGVQAQSEVHIQTDPGGEGYHQLVVATQKPQVDAFNEKLTGAAKGLSGLKQAALSINKLKSPTYKDQKFGNYKGSSVANAFSTYSGNSYQEINKYLRAKSKNPDTPAQPNLDKLIKAMRAGLDQSHLESSVVVYRGTSTGIKTFGEHFSPDKSMVGAQIKFSGLMSTSTSRGVAQNFAGYGGKGMVMRIVVPKGMKAVSLHGGQHTHEDELLLPDGTELRVVADNGYQNGYRQIDLEVVKTP